MSRTLWIANKNLSSWSLRAWLALARSGLPFEERLVRFEAPGWKDALAGVSPTRRVPVLQDGDLVVWDSLAICEHVAEDAPALWPADRARRSRARSLAAEMHAGFAALRRELSMDVRARHPSFPLSREAAADVGRIRAIFAAKEGPFLCGDFSIADAMFAPVAFRLRTYGVALEGAGADYLATMLALPEMKAWSDAAEAEPTATDPPDPTAAEQYWAVIFTSVLANDEGYAETARAMDELARAQPGFRGIESARGTDGLGLTVSYWSSLGAIAAWKSQVDHRQAQARGRSQFYERYQVRVCSVERAYSFPRGA